MYGNRNLYWAFGLVAGSWAICLMVTGVVWVVSQKKVVPTQEEVTLTPFTSDTEFRTFFADSLKKFVLPAELPITATASAPLPLGITVTPIYTIPTCPLEISKQVVLPCTHVWHPVFATEADSVFTIATDSGRFSFVGSKQQTVVYSTPQAFYLTFPRDTSELDRLAQMLIEPNNLLVDTATKEQIKLVTQLPISQQAKQVEIEQLLLKFQASMGDEERRQWEVERDKQLSLFVEANKRSFERTLIAKLATDDFKLEAMGEVPGHLLNQHSLKEYQGRLQVATTSDVYVLDQQLKLMGSGLDVLLGKRIYSTRFIDNHAFVASFEVRDPLTVIDLRSMTVLGTVPISGYTSQLVSLDDGSVMVASASGNPAKEGYVVHFTNNQLELEKTVVKKKSQE